MSNATLTVANEILAQLGGNRFLVMTGAKNLAGSVDTLSFKLPSRFAKDGINHVSIKLDPSDTYTVKFGKVCGVNYKVISTHEGIYADMLQGLFTRVTGLDTHL